MPHNASNSTPYPPGQYWQAYEKVEVASAPMMSSTTDVGEKLEELHARRKRETNDALRQQSKWFLSHGVGSIHEAPPSSELEFRDKRRQYIRNRFVRFMADFDMDTLQNASINYQPMPLPLEEYLKMINNVRQHRVGFQVEPVIASLPHPSIAYTPFHRDIARQKMYEKKFRVHYLTGGGRKFPFFYNAADDCFWKKTEDGTVACVLEEQLKRKAKHDPAVTVAIDQTGLYDRIEEAPLLRTLQCADFYLEKATWTYYCVPDLPDIRIPKDYKKMQRYKSQLNKYHFHQWALNRSEDIELPELYRAPHPAGSPPLTENSVLNLIDTRDSSRKDFDNTLINEAKVFIRGNHPVANATLSAVDAQYPMQEGVLILTPRNFTVAAAPALTVLENELLVAGSKKFAKYYYDVYELEKASRASEMRENSSTPAG